MGIHVTRSSRGAAPTIFTRRPGEKARPQKSRPGKGGAASGGGSTVKTGGTGGTRGDFGADFE